MLRKGNIIHTHQSRTRKVIEKKTYSGVCACVYIKSKLTYKTDINLLLYSFKLVVYYNRARATCRIAWLLSACILRDYVRNRIA